LNKVCTSSASSPTLSHIETAHITHHNNKTRLQKSLASLLPTEQISKAKLLTLLSMFTRNICKLRIHAIPRRRGRGRGVLERGSALPQYVRYTTESDRIPTREASVSAMKQSAESGDEFDLLIIGGGSVGTGT
jgi:hypothetical protein